jgi:hypothetical protein
LTVSTFFAFGMSEVLPQNEDDEFPATLTGAAGVLFVALTETEGDGETDLDAGAEGEGRDGDGEVETAGTAAGAAAGRATGVRDEGPHPATRATTDTAKRLDTRKRTRAA